MINPDSNGLYHPASEQDIIDLTTYAIKNKLQVRVRGAAQSVSSAVYTDGYPPAPEMQCLNINIELDLLRDISFDDVKMQATIGGGINLGNDPYDPSGMSQKSADNNLLQNLNAHGWAIQNVPDAIHQTISGYISTGSQAGSMMHSFDDCIIAIRLIDGTGKVQIFTRSDDPENHFFAVGVSMGLLGVITSVTLQCVAAFNIIGQELITNQNDCEFDLLGNGSADKKSLQDYITDTEFSRTLWWPFPTLKRIIAWKAKTMQSSDYNENTTGSQDDFAPKPYKPVFPKVFGSTVPARAVAGTGFRIIANYPQWFYDILGSNPDLKKYEDILGKMAPYLYPFMINLYFPLSGDEHPAQRFWDYWNGSLPMDTIEFSDNLFNLVYTELWVPLSDANKAVNVLNDFYTNQGMSLVSYYTVEILATKKSNFWMSPAYNGDVIRFNIMRFDTNKTAELTYYQQFWDLMKTNDIPFTVHWGKYLPPPDTAEGSSYLTSQYPKWNDFKSLRSQMDPGNIFLTNYWKSQLGIN